MSSYIPTVLFVASRGTLGGPSQSLLTLLGGLDGRVHRLLAAPSPLIAEARSRGVIDEALPLGCVPVPSRLSRVWLSARLAAEVLRRRRALVAIHVNNLSGLNLAGPAALLGRGRVVVWSHASSLSSAGARAGRIWSRLIPGISWCAVSNSASVLIDRHGLATTGEVAVVPNPVDPMKVADHSPGGQVTIAYLGGPAPLKGYHLVASVVERLRAEPLRWFVVAGSEAAARDSADPATRMLQRLAGDRLTLSGWVGRPGEVYAMASIVLCPSYRESFGLVVAEAMSNAIPVVASDIPAHRELLGDEEAGLLFPTGDAVAAAQAIAELAGDSELRARLGAAGKARAGAYTPEWVAERMMSLYLADAAL